MKFDLFTKDANSATEYIDSIEPFYVIDIFGNRHTGFYWGRIFKPSKNTNDHIYRAHDEYLFLSVKLSGEKEDYIIDIDKKEYNRLKKIADKRKRFKLTNNSVVSLSLLGLIIALFGLFLNALISLDKIYSNTKKAYPKMQTVQRHLKDYGIKF